MAFLACERAGFVTGQMVAVAAAGRSGDRCSATPLDREALRRLAGHPDQLRGAELSMREDGTARGVRVRAAAHGGDRVDVVVDRALDLGAGDRAAACPWRGSRRPASRRRASPYPHGYGTVPHVLRRPAHDLRPRAHARAGRGRREPLRLPRLRPPGLPAARPALDDAGAAAAATGSTWERECVVLAGDVRQAQRVRRAPRARARIRIGPRRPRAASSTTSCATRASRRRRSCPLPRQRRLAGARPGCRGRRGRRRAARGDAGGRGPDWRRVDAPGFPSEEQVWEHTPRRAGGSAARPCSTRHRRRPPARRRGRVGPRDASAPLPVARDER